MPEPPTQVIERTVPQRVTLRLKDGRSLTGRLVGIDEHMNLVIDDTEETNAEVSRRLGRVVVRGSNVVSLNAPSGASAKTA